MVTRFALLLNGLLAGFVSAPAFASEAPLDAPPAPLAISAAAGTQGSDGGVSALDRVMARQGGAADTVATPALMQASFAFANPLLTLPTARRAHAARPDIFGSVALTLARTPFDARVRSALADAPLGEGAKVAASLASLDRYDAILAANAFVNSKVAFLADARAHGQEDRWSTVAETLRRGTGDCEDYAIAKLQLLRAAGFAADDLHFVILKDLVRRADHAVLVVRHEGRFLVLDNGTDRLLDSDEVRDYRPIFSFAGGKAWAHGYQKRDAQPAPGFRLASL